MGEQKKRGYWDVNRCAWVDAEPQYAVPPTVESEQAAPTGPAELPGPRPADTSAVGTTTPA
jgi:hypothetical protein